MTALTKAQREAVDEVVAHSVGQCSSNPTDDCHDEREDGETDY